jgi:hypothetical protein
MKWKEDNRERRYLLYLYLPTMVGRDVVSWTTSHWVFALQLVSDLTKWGRLMGHD